jgi:hypothetical protein
VVYCNINIRPQSLDWEKDLLDFDDPKVWNEEKKARSSPQYIYVQIRSHDVRVPDRGLE